ncbi:P-II family nitrogen regulator [Sinomonas atrocyanea]|uniref:Nitrogen regulatory protein P-II n=1 Tax=Sinomonas atrocyanea TaxID=37927 RepID=A0A127A0X2_9MICC|nr:P-II family nitrogen regulator [Sinomonas atrocyanea]AMM33069.1 nitrogen regulatory protein P-II 1 [Sinomonas atrocyanea]MDP9883771.1 nitrogen regulatory protein P-II 1 [Sinomonas atrocyanea]MDQ0258158.1 nitrogen regulatory protein P-II 1 [Sinomonas atrocyanea]MDR6623072.1 nitrogen regulatory protein P-II 1 [Sinomonas atrocyanea]GEB65352.1 nitrogen regulatory protein P-II 1 [Sinomonas atrocyanea]
MKLITAIVRPEKLDSIREGLEAYGVQGLTVSAASGYGRQRGYTEVYRGAEYSVDLVPKVRIEVLATDDQTDDILDVLITTSNTGRAGDGKVWTVDVHEAIRVRTGERGAAAI